MSALGTDPLLPVKGVVDDAGCDPTGPLHKFTARCPGHDDHTPSLSVTDGADGRVLVYCHTGCQTETVVSALSLGMSDLFPAGHYRARPLLGIAKPSLPITLVLTALLARGIPYHCTPNPYFWVADICPACKAGPQHGLWIQEDDEDRREHRVTLACLNGCSQVDVLAALTGTTKEGGHR